MKEKKKMMITVINKSEKEKIKIVCKEGELLFLVHITPLKMMRDTLNITFLLTFHNFKKN